MACSSETLSTCCIHNPHSSSAEDLILVSAARYGKIVGSARDWAGIGVGPRCTIAPSVLGTIDHSDPDGVLRPLVQLVTHNSCYSIFANSYMVE